MLAADKLFSQTLMLSDTRLQDLLFANPILQRKYLTSGLITVLPVELF